jgi:hypothetical protein
MKNPNRISERAWWLTKYDALCVHANVHPNAELRDLCFTRGRSPSTAAKWTRAAVGVTGTVEHVYKTLRDQDERGQAKAQDGKEYTAKLARLNSNRSLSDLAQAVEAGA